MKFTLLFTVSLLTHTLFYAQTTTLFSQDFSSSTTLSNYKSTSPNSGQFNYIGLSSSTNPGSVTILNQKVVFDRPSSPGASSGFTRNQVNGTATASGNLLITFTIKVDNTTVPASGTNPGLFYVGESYATGFGIPSNSATFSRLGIVFTSTPTNFILKDWGTGAVSSEFSGEQTIFWVMNNSGSTMNYTSPTGTTVSLPQSKIDVWIGTTHVFNAVTPQTSTVSLSDFKFTYSNGTGSITLDDIVIKTISNVTLPIQLSYFKAVPFENSVKLNWQTLSEKNNDHFEIEHSTDGIKFTKIGEVKGQINSELQHDYQYAHEIPSVGNGFYRLRHVDLDGHFTFSKIEEVVFMPKKLILYPNPTKDVLFLQNSENTSNQPYSISDSFGRILLTGYDNNESISVQFLPKGFYFMKKGYQIAQFIKE